VPIEGPDGAPEPTGFLAESAEEYCDAITRVLVMDQVDRLRVAAAAQRHAAKFSTENFTAGFLDAIEPVLGPRRGGGGGGPASGSGGGGSGGGRSGSEAEEEEEAEEDEEEEAPEGHAGSDGERPAAGTAGRGPTRRAVRRA
jgi:hypothetical protein